MKRGGSWNYGPQNCRSANRNNNTPDNRNNNLGFRVLAARRLGRSARRRTGQSPVPFAGKGKPRKNAARLVETSGCRFERLAALSVDTTAAVRE